VPETDDRQLSGDSARAVGSGAGTDSAPTGGQDERRSLDSARRLGGDDGGLGRGDDLRLGRDDRRWRRRGRGRIDGGGVAGLRWEGEERVGGTLSRIISDVTSQERRIAAIMVKPREGAVHRDGQRSGAGLAARSRRRDTDRATSAAPRDTEHGGAPTSSHDVGRGAAPEVGDRTASGTGPRRSPAEGTRKRWGTKGRTWRRRCGRRRPGARGSGISPLHGAAVLDGAGGDGVGAALDLLGWGGGGG